MPRVLALPAGLLLTVALVVGCGIAEDAGGGAYALVNDTDMTVSVVLIRPNGQEQEVEVIPARQRPATYKFAGPHCTEGTLVARAPDGSEVDRIVGPDLWRPGLDDPRSGTVIKSDSRGRGPLARAPKRAVIVGVVALVVAGCQTDTTQLPQVRVVNDTAEPVVVIFDEPGHRLDLGTLDPGRVTTVTSVFTELGPGCHGPFVAVAGDGTEIDRLDRACSGTDWRIRSAEPSLAT